MEEHITQFRNTKTNCTNQLNIGTRYMFDNIFAELILQVEIIL